MGDSSFLGCTSLTSVVIGKGITSIKGATFLSCKSLENVNYRGSENEWSAISKPSNLGNNTGDYTINFNFKDE